MKMLSVKHILAFFFLYSFLLPILAQDYLFDVQIINIEDGLPYRRVLDVAQDKDGFIWISTPGKISRYDGHQFKTYDAGFLNIPDYAGVSMAFDETNNLWYSVNAAAIEITYGGVLNSRRDTTFNLETFTKGKFKSKDILNINRSKFRTDEWFITTRQGNAYKYKERNFEQIYHYPKIIANTLSAQQTSKDSYWIMHENELMKIVHQQIQQTFSLPKENGYPIRINKIIQQYPKLIIKSFNRFNGFQYWMLKEGRFLPYTLHNNDTNKLFSLFHLNSNYLVFATNNQLIIQDTKGKILFKFDEFEDNAFGKNKVKCNNVFLDNQNILWLATENGLIKITQQKNPFTQLFPKNSTRGIYLDDQHRLIVGGYKDNILRNLNTEAEIIFFQSSSLGQTPVMGFCKDVRNHLWVGTSEPLLLEYIPGQKTPIEYRFKPTYLLYLPYENPMTKTLWIGTNNGLYQLNKLTKQFIPQTLPIPSLNVEVRHFHQNQMGIWAVTNKGLFLIDQKSEKLIKHYTLADGFPNDNFTHLHEDKKGLFWLTTKGGGLIRWDMQKNKFTSFTQEKGLSSNTLYAVYEDEAENLWLPSDYGLMCFDKNMLSTQVYLPQNGIAHEEFNTFSHFKAANGQMYFGGLNGVTSFHPKEVLQNESNAPPLFITKVSTLEEDQEEFVDKTTAFQQTKTIELNPNHRILTLELSLLDYAQSAKNQYAYQIEGYQNQWIYTRENKISLINLPYGKFILKLKGRGASGSWSKQVLDIPLLVKKPFYLQWWFVFLLLISIAAAIFAAIQWRINRLERDRERLETEVKKRTLQIEKDKTTITEQAAALQALDKAKTRFFSNITHEFRTPLTLIIGPLQQMIKAPKEKITPQRLSGVLHNAQNILKLINQLLDISKLEDGKMRLEITRGNIIYYTQTLVDGFEPLANKKNHRIIFLTQQKNDWVTHFDKDKWNKIIYNLLFNAIKFTPPYGVIQIALRKIRAEEKEWIYLKVRDSGIGIAKSQLPQIFNRFYQADGSTTRMQEGTGIGLSLVKELIALQGGTIKVISKVGKGTSFEIRLPINNPETIAIHPSSTTIDSSKVTTPTNIAIPINVAPSSTITQPGKLKLLIIEDNEEMRTYIQSCIAPERYTIITAVNGMEGIEKAQTFTPDLIISDVMMPLKDGFEVTQTIREHIATSHIPIILLTAKAALESKLEGLKRGADAYLTKPFSPEELTLRIQKLIEIRQLLQNRYQKNDLPPSSINPITTFDKEDVFITRLRQFIIENIDDSDLNGTFIGKKFKISRMQLHRKLKALTNLSTTEFIQSIRLEIALTLLQQKELNVSEVALQTGFNSLTHFTRKFKQKYQTTPSEVLK